MMFKHTDDSRDTLRLKQIGNEGNYLFSIETEWNSDLCLTVWMSKDKLKELADAVYKELGNDQGT